MTRRWITGGVVAAIAFVLTSRGAFVCVTSRRPESLILLCNAVALVALMNAPARWWRAIGAAVIPIVVFLAFTNVPIAFYEGVNPSATGYGGVKPRVVEDLRTPDAYRIVASGVAGHPLTAGEAGKYWASKAWAFMRAYPAAGARLTARKVWFALHSYEAYDDAPMAARDAALSRLPIFLPFGLLVGLWTAAARRRLQLGAVWIFLIASALPAIVFGATACNRIAMLPAAAVLAAAGLVEIIRRNNYLPALAAVGIGIFLSVNGNAQREDFARWFGSDDVFDQAIAFEKAGRWQEADIVLRDLKGSEPIRGNRAVSSIAYYRARAAMQLGQPRAAVLHLLAEADREAPGNEHVLALEAANGDRRAERLLFELHDPFTARRALATALRH